MELLIKKVATETWLVFKYILLYKNILNNIYVILQTLKKTIWVTLPCSLNKNNYLLIFEIMLL